MFIPTYSLYIRHTRDWHCKTHATTTRGNRKQNYEAAINLLILYIKVVVVRISRRVCVSGVRLYFVDTIYVYKELPCSHYDNKLLCLPTLTTFIIFTMC